jgi:maltose O-acetyltransferase
MRGPPRLWFHAVLMLVNLLPFTALARVRAQLLRSAGVRFGARVSVAGRIHLSTANLETGNDVWIGDGTAFYNSGDSWIRLGSRIDIAPHCVFCTGTHETGGASWRAGTGKCEDIEVGDGCWVGIRATVLAGVTLGDGCIVAAGAVVTASTPDHVLVGGVPARVLKRLPAEG